MPPKTKQNRRQKYISGLMRRYLKKGGDEPDEAQMTEFKANLERFNAKQSFKDRREDGEDDGDDG